MKVRFDERSLRLRITPGEMAALARGEPIEEALAIAGAGWRAAIIPGPGPTAVSVEGPLLSVQVAPAEIDQLRARDAEGIYFDAPGRSGVVHCSIEKDYPCAHPRGLNARTPAGETFEPPPGFAERNQE